MYYKNILLRDERFKVYDYHIKLVERMIDQTHKTIFGLIIVSSIYIWVYFKFIPLEFLLIWLFFQIIFIYFRFKNAQVLSQYIKKNDTQNLKRHIVYFFISIVISAMLWNGAVVLGLIYAPVLYELVSFIMIVGIITAGALSLASMYYVYVTYFFLMILPQLVIMLLIGDHLHLSIALFLFISFPVVILLSKSIYANQLSIIQTNDSLERSVYELKELSITDSLTGIYNRRHFFDTAKRLLSIAKREDTKISLIMIDIDYFKHVNDAYGHQFGDVVLIKVAHEIRNVIRDSDILARVGGEEFAALLHSSSLSDAKVIAEKMRVSIEKALFLYKDVKVDVAVSIGVAELSQSNDSVEKLYKAADEKLYEAKESGRNRVC